MPSLRHEKLAYNTEQPSSPASDESGRGPLAGPVVAAACILGRVSSPTKSSKRLQQLTDKSAKRFT